jgi:hypothetical protein
VKARDYIHVHISLAGRSCPHIISIPRMCRIVKEILT